MFKKITALLLLTAFTNVYAFTPVEFQSVRSEELSRTFDSLNYKLNVEWDQQDTSFFKDSIADFEKEISVLQNEGLTKDELLNYTLDKIKDKEVLNEVNQLSKVISDSQMTNEEARAFTIAKLNNTYSEGASWSGSHRHGHVGILIGAIIVILVVVCHKRDSKPDPKTETKTDPKPNPIEHCQYSSFSSQSQCHDNFQPVY